MIKIKILKINRIIRFLKGIPLILAEHFFLTSLISFLIALILGAAVFLKYYLWVENQQSDYNIKEVQFNERFFQETLNFWQEREKRFQEADFKTYLNPFLVD